MNLWIMKGDAITPPPQNKQKQNKKPQDTSGPKQVSNAR